MVRVGIDRPSLIVHVKAVFGASRLDFGFSFLRRRWFLQSGKPIRSSKELINAAPAKLSSEERFDSLGTQKPVILGFTGNALWQV